MYLRQYIERQLGKLILGNQYVVTPPKRDNKPYLP
jgi:hypothetical protein